jgi:hypothetical protein
MKNWRDLASRYDKLAVVFSGSVILAVIMIRLEGLPRRAVVDAWMTALPRPTVARGSVAWGGNEVAH